ncbi:MAG: zinc-dependent metalloprotease [Gemmatimonadaceae bacterium]
MLNFAFARRAAFALLLPSLAAAQPPTATIASKTVGFERRDGFVPLYIDGKQGKLYVELPRGTNRALMWVSLASGFGSNPVGLDRGASGSDQVVRFDRDGDKVLMVVENTSFRTSLDNPAHKRSIDESFPPSIVAALPVIAEEGDRTVVDMTEVAYRDWNDISGTLARLNQGSYGVARDRSSIDREHTRSYPGNTEIDVALTFSTSGRPGGIVGRIAPDGRAFTLRQHISILPLPDASYRPRELDPRVGFYGVSFKDYGQPIQRALEQRWINRHRLQRVDPNDPRSPIRNPIRYWVDPGIPEPMKQATLDGVRFWTEAFDKAGLAGGFVAEFLPTTEDPLDARYNVVQWENRNERGWSVGGSLGDPRTGEILKGMARMDSHRARTDYNLYAALMGADAAAADTHFVLARVRQVSAHEVGHTLGMQHNYIASTYERGSVMDYPAPRVRLTNGEIDLTQAYGTGPGDYDVWAVRWGYGIFPAATERDSLAAIVAEGLRKGYLYLSDGDARPENASDPRTNLWDDAESASEFLKHQTGVRRVALSRFGLRNIRVGEPVATLQERLAPLYFWHRFALNGVTKTIGGMTYQNALRGDGQTATNPIAGAQQRQALSALLAELQPTELAIPDTVLSLLGPRPSGYDGPVNNSNSPVGELFRGRTDPAFDEISAARTLSQMIVDGILQRERAGRLVTFAGRGKNMLTLGETIDSLVAATWGKRDANASEKVVALRRVSQRAVADRLMSLAADVDALPEVRAMAEYQIGRLRVVAVREAAGGDMMNRAHWSSIAGDFARWIDRRELPKPSPALVAPPGDPFGMDP